MKEKTDNQKLINSVNKVNNEGLFISIFYTLIYGLAIMAAIVLPTDEFENKVLILIVFPLLIILCWILYVIGKKKAKETKITLDRFEFVLDIEGDVVENLSDVQAQIYVEKIQVCNSKFQEFIKYTIYLLIFVSFSAILLLLLNFVGSPQWILITLLVLQLMIIIYLSSMCYILYKKFQDYIRINFKD